MGLGPTGANGQFISSDMDETVRALGPQDQCSAMATAAATDNRFLNYVCIFLVLTTWVIVGLASWWLFKTWKHAMSVAEEQHYYLGLQVAELDAAYTDYSGRLIHAEFGLGETARGLEFLQDYASSTHYGQVEIEGFCRYSELSAAQNRHMCTTERGNM